MIAAPMPPRRAQAGVPKVTVCGKVTPTVAEALRDVLAEMNEEAHPATITMSQLIEHVLTEYVDRRGKGKPRR
jgi:hypothetical protein